MDSVTEMTTTDDARAALHRIEHKLIGQHDGKPYCETDVFKDIETLRAALQPQDGVMDFVGDPNGHCLMLPKVYADKVNHFLMSQDGVMVPRELTDEQLQAAHKSLAFDYFIDFCDKGTMAVNRMKAAYAAFLQPYVKGE